VREVCLAAYAHQDLPFERLVEELQPERNLSRTPLFQVMFILQNTPMPEFQLDDLKLSPVKVERRVAEFDLILSMMEKDDQFIGILEYNTDLFNYDTIERFLHHFHKLIASVVAQPELHIENVELLSHTERQQLLFDWSTTIVDLPKDVCLHHLFEEQATRTPYAIAVIYEGEHLSYLELNQRANQLAHYLRELGVGPDRLVTICVKPSLEAVVAILAVLKAGGAYVPLDPMYPEERFRLIFQDTNTEVLLTQQELLDNFNSIDCEVICLDTDWQQIASHSVEIPVVTMSPENLAYVIYTSGSTGTPKGVMISHAAVCNRLLWGQDVYSFSTEDKNLLLVSLSFDVSVLELFMPLIAGASLVVAHSNGYLDTDYLFDLITEEEITVFNVVPSMLRVLVTEKRLADCNSLKYLFCGGEAMPGDLPAQFYALSGAELHNYYGPSEATIDTTFWICSRESDQTVIPIGYPIGNLQVYVLDSHLQPVPMGVMGELHIGGVGLARGYLNRPDVTAEKFLPNPYSNKAGARLYRTGDLARWLPDGSIEYLGRTDHQVKIRGYRIELGEIESALNQHPDVHESVVIARQQRASKRLVAYLVMKNGKEVGTNQLYSYLSRQLPNYMVPSAYVILDKLPLTANSKLDRNALPEPDTDTDTILFERRPFVEPRNKLELILSEIWASVLGLERVGVRDNFFELGGDSILAIQVIARACQAGLQLTPKQLFEHQTVAELAVVATSQVIEPEPSLAGDLLLMSSALPDAMGLQTPLLNLEEEEFNNILEEVDFEE
ncbi:MAG: amino acid adenylation domain-containing protein, partial [Acidobacteriota bacterium]